MTKMNMDDCDAKNSKHKHVQYIYMSKVSRKYYTDKQEYTIQFHVFSININEFYVDNDCELGEGGWGGHGKACWLIAYYTMSITIVSLHKGLTYGR